MKNRATYLMRGITAMLAVSYCVASAYAQIVSEADVKAAFVFNFLKFIDSRQFNSELRVCVVGDVEETRAFSELNGKNIDGRKISVVMKKEDEIASSCDVLYLGRLNETTSSLRSIKSLTEAGILTVGNSDAFIASGGVVKFFTESSKVRFAIQLKAARAASLRISSKLLAIASIIDGEP